MISCPNCGIAIAATPDLVAQPVAKAVSLDRSKLDDGGWPGGTPCTFEGKRAIVAESPTVIVEDDGVESLRAGTVVVLYLDAKDQVIGGQHSVPMDALEARDG